MHGRMNSNCKLRRQSLMVLQIMSSWHPIYYKPVVNDIPPQLLRDREKEEAFISSMINASNELYYASTLQYDVVNQVNPRSKNNNKFIHFPICPREETSNKGIMLTSATINKSLPLINKVGNDNYAVDEHTHGREIFLMLTLCLCLTIPNCVCKFTGTCLESAMRIMLSPWCICISS